MCYIAMCGTIGSVFFSAFVLRKVSILTNFVLALALAFCLQGTFFLHQHRYIGAVSDIQQTADQI